jgi:uncharacterized delta-60 repeat protein
MKHIHLILTCFATFVSTFLSAHSQTVDAFDPNVGGNWVRSLAVQADGKILIGGKFSTADGQTRNNIARLNVDGSLDTAFNPSADNTVWSLALQADGKILVGGDFTNVGGQPHNKLARLNPDGSPDPGFAPRGGGRFFSLQADGKMVVTGSFTSADGQTSRPRLARINSDGSLDVGFNANVGSGFAGSCLAIQEDGKVIVGFSGSVVIGGQTCNNIVRLNSDGSLDANFSPNIQASVQSIAVQADGKILVGGGFTSIAGQTRNSIARLHGDGSLDIDFDPNIGSFATTVYRITLQADGKILVGGQFSTIAGQTRSCVARINADGSLDANFAPNVGGGYSTHVSIIALQADGKTLIGGDFTVVSGTTRNRIARLANDTTSVSSLSVTGNSKINWNRGGSAPELSQVTFESWSGTSWVSLGNAIRVSGGWQMIGLSLPASGQIRAWGRIGDGGSSIIEQTTSYTSALSNYAAWTTANASGQAAHHDHDLDGMPNGVEYFMGASGNGFTTNPTLINSTVTWPKSPNYIGTFAVQTSSNLVNWTDVTDDSTQVTTNLDFVIWSRPASPEDRFVRLIVTPD